MRGESASVSKDKEAQDYDGVETQMTCMKPLRLSSFLIYILTSSDLHLKSSFKQQMVLCVALRSGKKGIRHVHVD
jgi:hypothetical protein